MDIIDQIKTLIPDKPYMDLMNAMKEIYDTPKASMQDIPAPQIREYVGRITENTFYRGFDAGVRNAQRMQMEIDQGLADGLAAAARSLDLQLEANKIRDRDEQIANLRREIEIITACMNAEIDEQRQQIEALTADILSLQKEN